MSQPDDFQKLTAELPERQRYFTPGWFADLLAARLSLGDTFWIGNYGTALVLVPLAVLYVLLTRLIFAPATANLLFALLMLAIAAYYLALLRAVVLTALPRHDTGGWRWAGIAVTAAAACGAVVTAISFIAG